MWNYSSQHIPEKKLEICCNDCNCAKKHASFGRFYKNPGETDLLQQTLVSNEKVRRHVGGVGRRHVGSDGDLDTISVRHVRLSDALRPAADVSLPARRHLAHDRQTTTERRRAGNTAVYDVTVTWRWRRRRGEVVQRQVNATPDVRLNYVPEIAQK